jgi:formamidopyrimidine-DNA glycosylase
MPPELPEVETIKRQITEFLPLEILEVEFSKFSKSIVKTQEFIPTEDQLVSISRHGKMMIFNFRSGRKLLSHLGMSGSWQISKEKITKNHTHVQMIGKDEIGDDVYLGYVDPRRFGNIYFVSEENSKLIIKKLGIDISTDAFTADYLFKIFQKFPKKILKPFLLDQKYFAGIGNYIACEICARARLMPDRIVGDLSIKDCQKIVAATKTVIEGSIQRKGMTFHGGYVDATGSKGEGLKNLVVFYQKICGLCEKTEVVKIELGKRGTYFCPKCQK